MQLATFNNIFAEKNKYIWSKNPPNHSRQYKYYIQVSSRLFLQNFMDFTI